MQLNEKNKNSIAQLKDTLGFSTGHDAVRSKTTTDAYLPASLTIWD